MQAWPGVPGRLLAEIGLLREALAGLQSQVADLAAQVPTEHQLLTLLCGCGCETKAQARDGVTAPVQYGPRIMGTGIYLRHGQFLSRDRACRALSSGP